MSEQTYTPPPVSGYRTLSQTEVDLMNRIKAHESETMALVREVQAHVKHTRQNDKSMAIGALTMPGAEVETVQSRRMNNAEPERWASIARTDLQTGFMALVRAVAQPFTP